MKSLLKIIVLVLALTLFDCSNDDDSGNSNQEFSPEMLNGTWRISLFTDESSNRTEEFEDYEFLFNTDQNSVQIIFGGNSPISDIDIYQDTVEGETKWIVCLEHDIADLEDIIEDWIVTNVNSSGTTIEFEERFSNNTPEILHLSKVVSSNN